MKKQQPRQRRLDLINSLPRGKQKEIARQCNCSKVHVSMVLNGNRSQTNDLGTNIIRLAEREADRERQRQGMTRAKRALNYR